MGIGTAVIDAHDGRLAVCEVGDLEPRTERQGAMGGRHRVHVEAFAAGGRAAVMLAPVEGGDACSFGFMRLRIGVFSWSGVMMPSVERGGRGRGQKQQGSSEMRDETAAIDVCLTDTRTENSYGLYSFTAGRQRHGTRHVGFARLEELRRQIWSKNVQ